MAAGRTELSTNSDSGDVMKAVLRDKRERIRLTVKATHRYLPLCRHSHTPPSTSTRWLLITTDNRGHRQVQEPVPLIGITTHIVGTLRSYLFSISSKPQAIPGLKERSHTWQSKWCTPTQSHPDVRFWSLVLLYLTTPRMCPSIAVSISFNTSCSSFHCLG